MHNAHTTEPPTAPASHEHEQGFVLDKNGHKMCVARFSKDMNAFPQADIAPEQLAIIKLLEEVNRERFRFLAAEGKRYENDE